MIKTNIDSCSSLANSVRFSRKALEEISKMNKNLGDPVEHYVKDFAASELTVGITELLSPACDRHLLQPSKGDKPLGSRSPLEDSVKCVWGGNPLCGEDNMVSRATALIADVG